MLARHNLRHQREVISATSLNGQVSVDTVTVPLHIVIVKVLLVLLLKLMSFLQELCRTDTARLINSQHARQLPKVPIGELQSSPVIDYLKLLGRIQQVILGFLDQLFNISGHATAGA